MKCKSILVLVCLLISGLAYGQVVINEVMYNSNGDDVEFVELFNASASAEDLSGWTILDDNDGHDACPLSGTLAAGAYLVVVGNPALFNAAYPSVSNINPHYFDGDGNGWSLGNGGDTVRLFDDAAALIDQVSYSDGGAWPASPDGGGPSLELLNPHADNALPTSWDPSTADGGTPGQVNSVFTENIAPICKNGERSIALPASGEAVVVTVLAHDSEGLAAVELFVSTGQGYIPQPMFDDATHGDAVAGDSAYSAIVPAQNSGTLVKYYAVATDAIGQTDSWPNNAPTDYHAFTVDYTPPALRITEVLAVNNSINMDASGEYDDWFEIHNAGSDPVHLGGMYVSSSMGSPKAFKLPSVDLAPGAYQLIWADNDTEQGALHADFKLSASGEEITLFETVDHGNILIHGWKFGRMNADVSMGYPHDEATAPEYLALPTPGAANSGSALFSSVCINEFLTTSHFGGPYDDWVELYNRGETPVDLSGCFLSDARSEPTKWTFPEKTTLNPGEFLVVYEDELGFNFSSEGHDVIVLTAADSSTGLDFYDFGPQQADISEGRFPDGASNWEKLGEPTDGEANSSTGVSDEPCTRPSAYTLQQNYPNPFNPVTTIGYALEVAKQVRIDIFNLKGQCVTKLLDATVPAGRHTLEFDAGDLPSGVYFCKMKVGRLTLIRKMMLVK